ncbi:MAG: response regulator transcription factor [Planctomycetes bacterium]|nr:response regulator transcription factor [Planctomycetota bacterium]
MTDSLKHILVVEDEEHLRTGIKYNLEAEGYEVSAVGDAPAALKLLEEHTRDVDLIVLDLMLPGMSGYAFCETIRGEGHDMPVLILSARTLAEDRIRGFDVGADQYLQKPFDLDELLSRVRNLLARSRRFTPASLRKGDLDVFEFGKARINFETFEVAVDGKPARLTAMDMKLLRYFIEHEGKVLSRADLLTGVWDQPGSLTTRTVDNFVMRLRKTFEPDPAAPRHFLSVRGAGYRFVSKDGTSEPTSEEGPAES